MRHLKSWVLALAAGAALTGAVSCGGGGGGVAGLEAGDLGIYIVDALPDPTISSVEIDIASIEANLGGYWVRLVKSEGTIDLLDHVDDPVLVAASPVSPGAYTQLRLRLSEVRVEDADGTHRVALSREQVEGIVVDFAFDMHAGLENQVLLDFNVFRSLRKFGPGQYGLVPSILPALRHESGCVFGRVGFGGFESAIRVRAEYVSGEARAPGTQINDAFAREDGSFRIWALPPGTYRIVAEALNPNEGVMGSQTFENVVVGRGEEVEVGSGS